MKVAFIAIAADVSAHISDEMDVGNRLQCQRRGVGGLDIALSLQKLGHAASVVLRYGAGEQQTISVLIEIRVFRQHLLTHERGNRVE